MPFTDRTNEFRACVESIRSRSSSIPSRDAQSRKRLLSGSSKQSKSDFARMASSIGKDIASTTTKLDKLAQLARRKTLFDDRPIEISELTYIIKQDIANLNKQIASLQAYVKSQKAAKSGQNQVDEHNNNVVMLLQSKLASTSMSFKDVLEIRTQNMKESKDRTEQFMYSTSSAATQAPSSNAPLPLETLRRRSQATSSRSDSVLFANSRPESASGYRPDSKGKGRAPDNDLLALDLVSAEAGVGNGSSFQQLQLVEQQDDYIQTRSTAIESIESTIAELGQIFTQLANMVAEQRETVQRIDADTIDIANNVSGAQHELLKYYASISSNRWLMLKVFGVIIVFFLVFILVS